MDNFPTMQSLGEVAARVLTNADAARAPNRITEPAIYTMPAAEYHADPCAEPSLSSSIAKLLLATTPAHARLAHPRLNPGAEGPSSAAMNLGSVAHELLLGKGGGFEVSPFDAYTTKEARAWRDEVVARGVTPIKGKDFDAAAQMATAIRSRVADIPGAERAFVEGIAESVVVWRDVGGPMCRAMIDWLDLQTPVVYDLKTTGRGLSDRTLQNSIADGLDVQAAFHLRGIEHVMPDLAGRIAWRWVFVEDEAPFEARVIELDNTTRTFGDRKAALAIEVWRKCLAENRWPGYPRKVERLEYAGWAETRWIAREMASDDVASSHPLYTPMASQSSGRLSEIAS